MANFFYPRTIEVDGNLSGSGVAEDPAGLKPIIKIDTVTSSYGNFDSLTSSYGNFDSLTGSYINNYNTVCNILSATTRLQTQALTASNSKLYYATASILHIDSLVNCTNGNLKTVTIDTASIQRVTSSVGVSASYFYGDGSNITNINPENINLSEYGGLAANNSWTGDKNSFNKKVAIGCDEVIGTTSGVLQVGHTLPSYVSVVNAASQRITVSDKVSGEALLACYSAGENDVKTVKNVFGSSLNEADGGPPGSTYGTQGFIGTTSNHPFSIRTNNSSRVYIKPDGKIGINTQNPDKTFEVNGDAEVSTNLYIGGALTVDTDSLFVNAVTSKVGIGTTSPEEKLHVAGNVKVNDTIQSNYLTASAGAYVAGNVKVTDTIQSNYLTASAGAYIGQNSLTYWNTILHEPVTITFPTLEVTNNAVTINKNTTIEAGLTMSGSILMKSGEGISFAAFGNATDMTSELLDDYEEGTWNGGLAGSSANLAKYTVIDEKYIKIGSIVSIWCTLSADADYDFNSNNVEITGLPFSCPVSTPALITCRKSAGGSAESSVSSRVLNTSILFETDPGGHRYFHVFASYRV